MLFPMTCPNPQGEDVIVRTQFTHKEGLRADSYSSYIGNPRLDHGPNLKVLCFSEVSEVLIKDKLAYGVQLERFGRTMRFKANKEVILSAGAFGSPKILMLSGIGPKKHLNEMGIDVKLDLHGVGSNLQDHMVVPYPFVSKNTTGLNLNLWDVVSPIEWLRYYVTRKGGSLGTGFAEGGLFYHSGFKGKVTKLRVCCFCM